MASKPKAKPEEKPSWNVAFFEPSFSVEDKAAVKSYAASTFDFLDLVEGFTQTGHKVSVSWDEPHACHVVSVTGKGKTNPNTGVCMVVRHLSAHMALVAATWYHAERCDSGSWTGNAMGGEFDW
jgi:hypothetical protein